MLLGEQQKHHLCSFGWEVVRRRVPVGRVLKARGLPIGIAERTVVVRVNESAQRICELVEAATAHQVDDVVRDRDEPGVGLRKFNQFVVGGLAQGALRRQA